MEKPCNSTHFQQNESPQVRARRLAKDLIRPYVEHGISIEHISASYPGMGYRGYHVGVGYPIFYKFQTPDEKRIPVSTKQIGVHLDSDTDSEYFQVFPLPTIYKEVARELGKPVPKDITKPLRRQGHKASQQKEPDATPPQMGFFGSEKVVLRRKRAARRTIVTKDGEEIHQMPLFTEDHI